MFCLCEIAILWQLFAPRIWGVLKIFMLIEYAALVVKCSINIKRKFIAMKCFVLRFCCYCLIKAITSGCKCIWVNYDKNWLRELSLCLPPSLSLIPSSLSSSLSSILLLFVVWRVKTQRLKQVRQAYHHLTMPTAIRKSPLKLCR